MTRKTPAVPAILPREPLTKKARAAIHKYAHLQSEKYGRIMHYMVEAVIAAERMRRTDLYAWLGRHGYRWDGSFWREKAKEKSQ
jgi:hypothetical protein